MTLQEISTGYGMPLERLYRDAGIPPRVAPATPLNKVAKTYNVKFEPEKVREVVDAFADGKASKSGLHAAPVPAGEEPEVKAS